MKSLLSAVVLSAVVMGYAGAAKASPKPTCAEMIRAYEAKVAKDKELGRRAVGRTAEMLDGELQGDLSYLNYLKQGGRDGCR